MHIVGETTPQPRRVTVEDRDDVGIVIKEGKNFGSGPGGYVYCVVVHFPDTGEVKFYDTSKVTTVQDG